MAETVSPSGRQVEIAHGAQRATVVEVGGGLRTYTAAGQDILDGYGADERCSGGRGQLLMPWPNRIRDGRYPTRDRSQQLALTEVPNQNAIHGLVRWAAWTVRQQHADRVVMEHVLHPQPGYPFTLELRVEYALTDIGLRVRTTATNIGQAACPFGSGAHPYLTVGVAPVDDVVLTAPGRQHLVTDDRAIPVGRDAVDGGPLDLRKARPVGGATLDDCFTDLERDADGLAWVHLSSPDGRRRVSAWLDDAYEYLMIFTGDTLSDRRRHAIAVEPMSCAPDAFNSGDGLVTLGIGDTFSGSWGIVPDPIA